MMYRVVALLAVLTLIVCIVLLSGPQHEASALIAPERPLHDPGYSATNARLVQTGADGRPVYTLDAAQIQQQPNDGLVKMQQVRLGFRDSSGNELTATALRGELARFEIDVLLIVPGLTQSGLSQHLLRKTGRAKIAFDQGMPPEGVAHAIVEAFRNNRTETVVGRDARWMLRAGRFLPGLVDRLLARRVRKLYAS